MWGDDDRAKAVAYERWLAEACPRCGTRDHDWHDDDGGLRREPAWEPVIRGCYGCERTAALDKAMPEGARAAGGRVVLIPRDDFDPQAEAARESELAR